MTGLACWLLPTSQLCKNPPYFYKALWPAPVQAVFLPAHETMAPQMQALYAYTARASFSAADGRNMDQQSSPIKGMLMQSPDAVLQAVVPLLASRDAQLRRVCSEAVQDLLAADQEGTVACEAVQLIAGWSMRL